MREREYLLRDRVGSKDQIILIVPERWMAPDVKSFINDPDYDIFELTRWSAKMVNDETIIMNVMDWLNIHHPENAEELYKVFVELESTND